MSMKATLLSTVAGGMLLAMAGVASANGPVTLNQAQMDAVTAGGLVAGQGFAFAGQAANPLAGAFALGLFNATTVNNNAAAVAVTGVVVVPPPPGGTPAQVVYVTATSNSLSQAFSQ